MISEKINPKEPSPHRKSPRKGFRRGGIMTDRGPKEIQPDVNIQPTITNNDNKNERDKSSSENVNSDM